MAIVLLVECNVDGFKPDASYLTGWIAKSRQSRGSLAYMPLLEEFSQCACLRIDLHSCLSATPELAHNQR